MKVLSLRNLALTDCDQIKKIDLDCRIAPHTILIQDAVQRDDRGAIGYFIGSDCQDSLNGTPIAYMLYECVRARQKYFRVDRIVVHPDHRRKGFGSRMLNQLIDSLRPDDLNHVAVFVSELALEQQMLFKACGFRYTRQATERSDRPYVMVYRGWPKPQRQIWSKRIAVTFD